jgi:hypothetical protein
VSDTGEHKALRLVLAVASISLVLGSAAKLASSISAADNTANEALAIAEEASGRVEALESSASGNLEDRLSDLESQTSELADQNREHSMRIDEVESEVQNQALMRSW